jgi:uncharacterized protein
MNRKAILFGLIFFIILVILYYLRTSTNNPISRLTDSPKEDNMTGEMNNSPHSLSIESLRQGDYPGSDLVVEQELTPGTNYQRYIVSFRTEGLKQYALLTVPNGQPPAGGWPAIVFNHGYIPPTEYRTTERYIAYTDAFSRNGYVLLRPDYRGHGESEGTPSGAYGSNNYTIDVLNAYNSLKKYPGVNKDKIGMWGHSMGGFITLRAMVTDPTIKAGVIWAGVVGSYEDLFERWRRRNVPSLTPSARGGSWRQALSQEFGSPQENPEFWRSLSANSYLKDISGPVQIHHGTNDTSVPFEFSETLESQLKEAGKASELYIYEGDDHNISGNFNVAAQRSVDFFDKYLK